MKSPFNRNNECGEPVMINTGGFFSPRPFMASCGLPKGHAGDHEAGDASDTPNAEDDHEDDQEGAA